MFALLKERGLERFYALQNRDEPFQASAPAHQSIEKFAYLDDPEFLENYSTADGREMRFYLEGVHCAACVWLTEKLPQFEAGVEFLKLNLSSGVARVRIRTDGSFARAAQEIARLGYLPHPVRSGSDEALRKKENRAHLIQLGMAGMLSGNIMLLAIALYAGADGRLAQVFRWTSLGLYLPVLFFSALPFYKSAWASLLKKQVSIDVPIVFGLLVGTAASIINLALGSTHIYFDSLSTLIFLLLSTRYLLKKVNQHALHATEVIHQMTPSRASKKNETTLKYEEVKTETLKENDLIEVLPGECIPVDGVVIQGKSSLNCALLTGEAQLISVAPGQLVNAGTWNQQAPLEVRVLASGAATRLGKILAAMEEGLAKKAPIVTYLDRVGQAFVLAVLTLTCAGFFLGLSVSWHEAINRALAVAIVVCPCTFALATPLAMSLAIARCAKNGILVKDPEIMERLSQVKEVFFDKTGTLTFGELQVTQWMSLESDAAEALLALESRSAHPVAKAVQRYFQKQCPFNATVEIEEFSEQAGVGVSGKIRGFLYEARASIEAPKSGSPSTSIETSIAVLRDGHLIGTLLLSDQIRSDSKISLERLRRLGLGIHLLSGDAPSPVQNVAEEAGIPSKNVTASASPEMKARIVQSTSKTLMVGDGANDAVALASAFASVAVRGGVEMSVKAAGAYSSIPGIQAIPSLIITARETMRVIRRNLTFAILYNVIGIGVALTGKLDPLFAAILMPMSAVSVFLSTLLGTKKLRRAFAPTQRKASQ